MPASLVKLAKLRASKSGQINTSIFNFLENLLVFRTMETLSVPPESSVKFRISRREGEPGICLLIHVDNQCFPVVEQGIPRPDYLAIYLHGDHCICTIIEMKSTAEKNLKHGVEQIRTLADQLKREFRLHLPRGFELIVQGILLCSANANVPGPLIDQVEKAGLPILAVQYSNRAELFPYVSKKLNAKMRFDNKSQRPGPRSFIEQVLSEQTIGKRIKDPITDQREGQGAGKGLHINLALSNDGDYAILMTREKKCAFVVSAQSDSYLQQLQADIDANDLGRKFDIELMPKA